MKVLLLKDVYKLGRAGDIKKVADGYGRNFLIPQGLAALATAGALKQVDKIRSQAEVRRTELNSELKDLAALINPEDRSKSYLRELPKDPFTGLPDWITVLVEGDDGGVFDVHSASDLIAMDGTPYNIW